MINLLPIKEESSSLTTSQDPLSRKKAKKGKKAIVELNNKREAKIIEKMDNSKIAPHHYSNLPKTQG